MKNALVIIDIQNYFVNEHAKKLPKKIASFIEKNKNKLDFVLFAQLINKNIQKEKNEDNLSVL